MTINSPHTQKKYTLIQPRHLHIHMQECCRAYLKICSATAPNEKHITRKNSGEIVKHETEATLQSIGFNGVWQLQNKKIGDVALLKRGRTQLQNQKIN